MTREQILETADVLFHECGFDNISLSDIAKAGGIRKGNFYYHFKSKNALLEAVIDRRLVATLDQLRRIDSDYPDPKSRLNAFIQDQLLSDTSRSSDTIDSALCLELAKLKHPALHQARNALIFQNEWLIKQIADHSPSTDAARLAEQILGRIQGALLLARVLTSIEVLQRAQGEISRWLVCRLSIHSNSCPSTNLDYTPT